MFCNILAIVREDKLNHVVSVLQNEGVPGVNVVHVKGYGEYINSFSRDLMDNSVKLEVITTQEEAEKVARIIMNEAHTGLEGDGIVAISPVTKLFRVRDKQELTANNLLNSSN